MKKILIVSALIICLLSQIVFGASIDTTANYLEKQSLDHWGVLALYASGKDISSKSLEKPDTEITTDYEAYVIGAVPLGKNVYEEVKNICALQKESGKFADYIDGTGEDFVNAHIWGIISLYMANYEEYNKSKALKWLRENQNSDGGFPVYVGYNNSDLDMTAMALVAYGILGMDSDSAEVKKAISFIENNIGRNESAESYSWYIIARIQLKLPVDKVLYENLMKYKLQDGSFKHLESLKKSNYMATWHGLLALSDYNNKTSTIDKVHNLKRFADLGSGEYAHDEIMALVSKNILSGYPDNTFKGGNPVKRGEFSKILVYALNLQNQISNETKAFNDLKGHWANKIVNVAVKNQLINGMGNGLFAPEAQITGAQVATLLVRAEGLEKEALAIKGDNWYDGYVQIAKANNLLYKGFAPNAYATRAQCAEAIYKLIN